MKSDIVNTCLFAFFAVGGSYIAADSLWTLAGIVGGSLAAGAVIEGAMGLIDHYSRRDRTLR